MPDLATVIEANVSEFLLSMGAAGGGTERADEEITWTVGGSPIGYHNAVVRCAATGDRGRQLVDEWLVALQERSVPGCWHLSPAMRPTGLGELLTDAGFQDNGDEPAMAVALAQPADRRAPSPLHVRQVRDEHDLGAYRHVLGEGFGEGPKEADWATSVFATIGLDAGSWQHFVGWRGDDPVATASLLVTGIAGGIYFVCTRPDARRQGFGALITEHAMVEAANAGARYAVLGSSPMGQGVYERLGFETVFTYRLFEWEP